MRRMMLMCAVCAAVVAVTQSNDKALEVGFVRPPGSARPHVYYMIMNGNMSKECITDDFEAMAKVGIGGAKVGIGGVLVLDVGCFIPPGPVVFASPEWYDIMLHLHKEAKRLGIEVTFPNCAGWSSSGGPWLKPEHGIKTVVVTETRTRGAPLFTASAMTRRGVATAASAFVSAAPQNRVNKGRSVAA